MDDITPFNELIKRLDTTTSTDQQVSQLAQRLLAQGLATTLLEAKEKARDMLKAEKKTNQGFTERKEQMTKYNDPRSDPNYYKKQNINELRQRALSAQPIKVQDEFQTPGYERKNGSAGLPRAVMRSAPEPTIEPGESPRPEQFKPEQAQSAMAQPEQTRPAPQPAPAQSAPQPAPQPMQTAAQPPQQVQQPAPQERTDEPKKEKKPGVSLHDIFNFGKK